MESLFQDQPVESRAKLLADNADKQEEQFVKRVFKQEEILEFKNELSSISIQTAEAEKAKAMAMKTYTSDVKILDTKRRELTEKLKDGYVEQEELLYGMADPIEGTMSYYDATGEGIYQRKLLPSERQTKDVRLMTPRAANGE